MTVAPPPVVSFDIQGMRIGDPLTDEFAYSHCPAIDKGKADMYCSESIEIGGHEVFVLFQFADFKLIGVSLSFKPDSYDQIVSAYTAKFGSKPHDLRVEELETRMGAKFENEIAVWNTDVGSFTVQKYAGSISDGSAILMTPQRLQLHERQRAEELEQLKSKL
ncbi:MAG: hypothetical protein ACO1RT_21050 [Planctomycetaceae bacterium]